MFEPLAVLIVATAILASVWLSLLVARSLMSAMLASMRHGVRRKAEAPGPGAAGNGRQAAAVL